MKDFFQEIGTWVSSLFSSQFFLLDLLDIIIVTVFIYMLLRIAKTTRAKQVLKGLVVLFVLAVVASLLNLTVLSWVMSMLLQSGVIIIIILFQPELRRGLEQLGRKKLLTIFSQTTEDPTPTIDNLIRTVQNLSKRRVGALIVIEQTSNLTDVCVSGTQIDGLVSSPLLENIFEPNTPLHDGAVIIKGLRIVAASCYLPLSENTALDRSLGTRHRAGLGLSERTDAGIIVVSEETGVISFAHQGILHRYMNYKALRERLELLYSGGKQKSPEKEQKEGGKEA